MTEMTEIQLTTAELEMITIKREQEELAKKEQQLKAQLKLQAEIAAAENSIASLIAEDDKQIAAAKAFGPKLPGWNFEIRTRPEQKMVKANWEDVDPIWSKTFERRTALYTYKTFSIEVSKHIVYGSSWRSVGTDKGYKMSLLGPDVEWSYRNKKLTNPATIIAKVAQIESDKKAKEEAKAKQLSAVESTIAKLKATYNDATIVEGTSGAYTNPYSRRDWINYPIVTVTLANGVKVVYRIYSDGSLGRLEITFPNQKDAYSLLSALNTL
jgi:hypothetical protein